MRSITARIALWSGALATIVATAASGMARTCEPTGCRTDCAMHRAGIQTPPEPVKSCCQKKIEAPKPEICKCEPAQGHSSPATIAKSSGLDVAYADLPRVEPVWLDEPKIGEAHRVEVRNHGPPRSIPRSPSIPRAPPAQA